MEKTIFSEEVGDSIDKGYKISQKFHLRLKKRALNNGDYKLAKYHEEIYEDQLKHGKIVEQPIREGYYRIIVKEEK